MLGLGVDDLQELAHAMLDCLDDVGFELRERVLHTNQVLAVVVLLLHLLVQTVVDSTLENVGVVGSFHVATVRVEDCGVLTKKLNVLLSVLASLVDSLTALAGSLCELLALVLDLGVQAVEDGEDGAFQLLRSLVVLVGDTLTWLEQLLGSCVERWRTWVLDLMFSNMPATPPSDWSKWWPSFRGSLTVFPTSAVESLSRELHQPSRLAHTPCRVRGSSFLLR